MIARYWELSATDHLKLTSRLGHTDVEIAHCSRFDNHKTTTFPTVSTLIFLAGNKLTILPKPNSVNQLVGLSLVFGPHFSASF